MSEVKKDSKDWHDLPHVFARVKQDELGYPPKTVGTAQGAATRNPDIFVLKSIPFFARGLSCDDEVAVTTSPEGYFPVIQTVVKRSGYSTIRLMIDGNEDKGN